MKKSLPLVLLSTLFVSATANAQDFGKAGQFAISAERMFGISHASHKQEPEEGDGSTTSSYTNITLLSQGPIGTSGLGRTAYTFPRLGADYFVIDGLSVGAALGWMTSSGEIEQEQGGTSQTNDAASVSSLLFAPRVGYAFMFQKMFGIWPRAGITYVSFSSEDDDGDEFSGSRLAATLEVPFVISPVEHVAFTAGPMLDLGISGGNENDPSDAGDPTTETDNKATEIGLNFGLTVWL